MPSTPSRLRALAVVAVQLVLFAGLGLPPAGAHFGVPESLGRALWAGVWLGALVLAVAVFQLGRELTPDPVPVAGGRLHVEGLYRHVRHPIYSALLWIAFCHAARSGNLLSVASGVALLLFFTLKAGVEERALLRAYPEYSEVLRTTPRFVPRLLP